MLEKYRNVIGEILAPFIILGIIVFLSVGRQPAMGELNVNKLAEAIYIQEGVGSRYPYGIKSIPCSTKKECRSICINTIKHRLKDFKKSNQSGIKPFIRFLAERYEQGQSRMDKEIWAKSVTRIYGKP